VKLALRVNPGGQVHWLLTQTSSGLQRVQGPPIEKNFNEKIQEE
jgi:hypothetical protein